MNTSFAFLAPRLLATLLVFSSEASAFDMRDCQIDMIIFVDPWDSSIFQPVRVGVSLYYACGDEQKIVKDPVDPAACGRPYGRLLIEGKQFEGDHDSKGRFLAVYELQKGASPCCGWSVFAPGEEDPEILDDVTWLKLGTSPRLGDWPFFTIFNDWGTRTELDGMAPLICNLLIS